MYLGAARLPDMGDPDRTLAALAASQHGVVHRRQLGLDRDALRWRLERGRLVRLARDVFAVAGAPATWERSLWAAHLEAGPDSVVAGRSAARLHGLPGWPGERVELLAPRRATGRAASLGTLRTTLDLPGEHVIDVRGLPCTRVARTLVDLAGIGAPGERRSAAVRGAHEARVARAVDHALARSLVTIPELEAVLAGARGRRGVAAVRRVMAERAPGYVAPESGLERRFLEVCRAAGLPEPRRQVVFGAEAPIGRVDFFFAAHGLVVEVDGAPFHDGLVDRERDRRRDNELAALGLRVLRVRAPELRRAPDGVAALVRAALDAARRRAA